MPPQVIEGRIIYRSWNDITGLDEGEVTFSSLDEMFELCLRVQDPNLVDRIILHGVNEQGEVRTLTFAFQSLKFSDEA